MKYLVLLSLVFVLTGCDKYKYGYRNCNIETHECLEVSAKFLKKDDCISHKERSSHGCFGGKYLEATRIGEPVCHKLASTLGYGECIDL